MIAKLGEKFTKLFLRYMPDAFVFAMLLTLLTASISLIWTEATPIKIISAWYDGFWTLLEFGMQIVLIIITGFAIALSPVVKKGVDFLTQYIKSPKQVYILVMFLGALLSIVSFGWIIITCVLARELAIRVKGINYPFLMALVFYSSASWVTGLSSSIPLLLGTENNYLIKSGVLSDTIPSSLSLGSGLNLAMLLLFIIGGPLLILLIFPKKSNNKELSDLLVDKNSKKELSIEEEAKSLKLPFKTVSDTLNNSVILQYSMAFCGFAYIIYYFITKGMILNFNIMIFIFLMVGLVLHKTPIRYGIAMNRSSSNISGILIQYPFYAGIMGIMLYTGLGEKLAQVMASVATITTYPFYSYITGALVNFAIPSAGGEFAVVGPSIINAVKNISTGMPIEQVNAMIIRASLSVAYGESLSNLLQPFFLLLVMPVMAVGIKIQARDIMGYLVIPFMVFLIIQLILVTYMPL
tara:strand:- start:10643 stop:12040 length:1398 start_codon:yes stop_codon:yes gene_type:complete